MIIASLVLLLTLFCLAGRIVREQQPEVRDFGRWESAFLELLTGLAVVSTILFLLMFTGNFRWPWIVLCLSAAALLPMFRSGLPSVVEVTRSAVLITAAAALTFTLYKMTPPYEALVGGDDASVYMAAAEQLAHQGSISYSDDLVKKMSPVQRDIFFSQSFP